MISNLRDGLTVYGSTIIFRTSSKGLTGTHRLSGSTPLREKEGKPKWVRVKGRLAHLFDQSAQMQSHPKDVRGDLLWSRFVLGKGESGDPLRPMPRHASALLCFKSD